MAPRSRAVLAPRALPVSELERLRDENRRLKDELFFARDGLVHLLDKQDLLRGFYGVRDVTQLREWRESAAEKVLAAAWVRPGEEMGDARWPRALCPLCGDGAQGARDVRGFAVPEGLRRHLLGELNSRQCRVFGAAEGIARDSVRETGGGRRTPDWSGF